MHRGFLTSRTATAASSKSSDKSNSESLRIADLESQLSEAEAELRRRRQDRLDLEASLVNSQHARSDPQTLLPLHEEAIQALASHPEPPPERLHRLAEALMLFLDARLLVDLGEHQLPGRVPWRNLQILLRKSWDKYNFTASSAALQQQPIGTRLRDHIRDRLLGGNGLRREQVSASDASCVPIFDFLVGIVGTASTVSAPPTSLTRDGAVEAVSFQEKKVARLRKQLREAKCSESNALAFAAEHAPTPTPVGDQSSPGDDELPTACQHSSLAKTDHVISCHSLQYRLNEVTVPPFQETVLTALAGVIVEPRSGSYRRLEVIGHSEDREEPDTAAQRAEAVRAWMVANGVPTSRVHVEAVAGGHRGARRVELRLLDIQQTDAVLRSRADEVLLRLFAEESPSAEPEDSHSEHVAVQVELAAPAVPQSHSLAESQSEVGQEATSMSGAPTVSFEEVPPTGSALDGRRGLRIVFAKPALSASDTLLEVGTQSVRLASVSSLWPELEVPLPFIVEPPAENAARFSRRAGTLTLLLRAATGAA